MSSLWTLITIAGPILLAAVLIWAILQNRKSSRREIARTEAATSDLYASEDRIAKRDDAIDASDTSVRR